MFLKRLLSTVLMAGCISSALATYSRVITMGRTSDFFMDETSIYNNPANINVYPNMLMGDLGVYIADSTLDATGNSAGLSRWNRDPQNPYFGAIISYSLNQSAETGDQYPMLSLGATFNRYDPMLDYITPGSSKFNMGAIPQDSLLWSDPIGKVDVILGYALKNGAMLGAGCYLAFQDSLESRFESKFYKFNVGVNWPLTKTMDLEVSGGYGRLTGVGEYRDEGLIPQKYEVADGDHSFNADVRLFSALTMLNGDFVPHAGFSLINLADGDDRVMDADLGVGINLNIDRGFFWAGVDGIYEEDDIASQVSQRIGGKIAFGIERNIVWDWFVWRAGGTKKILYESGPSDQGWWVENPDANATPDDLISFGVGINIENRLKVDGVVAEDVLYTFTNLFTGSHHHLMSRISVTYSF